MLGREGIIGEGGFGWGSTVKDGKLGMPRLEKDGDGDVRPWCRC